MGATCVNEEVKEMGLFKKKVLVQTYDKENKKPVIKSRSIEPDTLDH